MKNQIFITLLLILSTQLSFANDSSTDKLTIISNKGNYGLINQQGKVIIPTKYKMINKFSEDRIAVLKETKAGRYYALFDNLGKAITPFKFVGIGTYQEGLASASVMMVENGELVIRSGYIDKNGKFIIEPIYADTGSFIQSIASVQETEFQAKQHNRTERKFAFINKNQEVVLPFIYDDIISSFENRKDSTAMVKLKGKLVIINQKGNIVDKLE